MSPLESLDPDVTAKALQLEFKDSLYKTAKYLCGYKDINPNTHGGTIAVLESSTVRKLVVMPRGTFKTSLCVVAFTIWNIIRNPNIRILIDSELRELSVLSLREIREHINGERFQSVFPGWKFTLENEAKCIINQRRIPKKEPTVAASGIGAGKTGQHYDLILADDLNSPLNSLKPELSNQVIAHYRYYTSILDPGGGLVVSGTRYSEHDLIGHIIRTEIEDDQD